MVFITKSLRRFIESKDKSGYRKDIQRKNWNELVYRAEFAIKQLRLLAEIMPNRYTAKVFNEPNLMPLFKAIFQVTEDMTKENRTRLLEMAQVLINILSYDLAPHLAPELYALLKDPNIEKDMIGLKTIWLTRRGYDVKKT